MTNGFVTALIALAALAGCFRSGAWSGPTSRTGSYR